MDQYHGPVPDAVARRQLHLHRLQPLPAVRRDAEQQGAARVAGGRPHMSGPSAGTIRDTLWQLPPPCNGLLSKGAVLIGSRSRARHC